MYHADKYDPPCGKKVLLTFTYPPSEDHRPIPCEEVPSTSPPMPYQARLKVPLVPFTCCNSLGCEDAICEAAQEITLRLPGPHASGRAGRLSSG